MFHFKGAVSVFERPELSSLVQGTGCRIVDHTRHLAIMNLAFLSALTLNVQVTTINALGHF